MRACCTLLVAVAVFACAARVCAESGLVDGIRAVVQDSVVTLGELQQMTAPARDLLARQYAGQPEVFERKLVAALNDNLEQLMERQLVLQDFKSLFSEPERKAFAEKEIAKDVDKDIEAEIRTSYGGDRMSFVKTLQSKGITLERHRQQIHDRIVISWLRQKNIASEIIVSPHRVEAYYLAHHDEFKVQEEVKLRMIVLKCFGEEEAARTRKRAEEVLSRLKDGATFTELATIYSEGSQRREGGDLGWLELQSLSRYLADTAAPLQAGQHSGVMSRSAGNDCWVCSYEKGVPTLARHYVPNALLKEDLAEERRLENASAATNLPPPVEFYLMLVEDRRPARFKTLAEVRQKIEQDLVTEEQKRLEDQWVARLKKKTFVRVF